MEQTELLAMQQSLAGMQSAVAATAQSALAAAKAQTALAKATTAAAKAARTAIAGFDELHLTAAASKGGSAAKSANTAAKDKNAPSTKTPKPEKLYKPMQDIAQVWDEAFVQMQTAAKQAFLSIANAVYSLWKSAFEPLGTYITTDFIPVVLGAFSNTFAPMLADIVTAALSVLSTLVSGICQGLASAINTLLVPALDVLKTVFHDIFAAIGSAWQSFGATLLAQVQSICTQLFGIVGTLYSELLEPLFANLIALLGVFWAEHLAPLVENILGAVAQISTVLLGIIDTVLLPIVNFLVEIFTPVIGGLLNVILTVLAQVANFVADTVNMVITLLRMLLDFLVNVFTGEWGAAWGNICAVFGTFFESIATTARGILNKVIDCINQVLGGITAAINAITGALSNLRFTVPQWVPVFGGSVFGIDLPAMSAAQIPHLARGAVIPPNAEFLAVLGDQTHGRNLEAPEQLIRQIVREESTRSQSFTAEQPIELALDGDVFYRAMMKIKARQGVQTGGIFAHVY